MIVNRYLLTILALHKAAEQGHAEVGIFVCVCVCVATSSPILSSPEIIAFDDVCTDGGVIIIKRS